MAFFISAPSGALSVNPISPHYFYGLSLKSGWWGLQKKTIAVLPGFFIRIRARPITHYSSHTLTQWAWRYLSMDDYETSRTQLAAGGLFMGGLRLAWLNSAFCVSRAVRRRRDCSGRCAPAHRCIFCRVAGNSDRRSLQLERRDHRDCVLCCWLGWWAVRPDHRAPCDEQHRRKIIL